MTDLSFHEALRAAWAYFGHKSWRISRGSNDYLAFNATTRYYNRSNDGSYSPMAPEIPAYWIDGNNWTLTIY